MGRPKGSKQDISSPYLKRNQYQRIEVKNRRCLKCGDEFKSIGPGNRICECCSKGNKLVYNPSLAPVVTDTAGRRLNGGR